MKKILGIVVLGLLFCNVSYSETKKLDEELSLSNLEGVTNVNTNEIDFSKFTLEDNKDCKTRPADQIDTLECYDGKIVFEKFENDLNIDGNLNGKKLYCFGQKHHYSFIFTYFSKVKVIKINPKYYGGKLEPFKEHTYKYVEYPNSIIFKAPNSELYDYELNRISLDLNAAAYTKCESVSKEVDLKQKMKNTYDLIVKSKKSKNKF